MTQVTKAENYDDYEGVKIVEESKDSDYAVGEIDTGGWIEFRDVHFKNGVTSIRAEVASLEEGNIEIRLGNPKGKLVGNIQVHNTGSLQTWKTTEEKIKKLSGKHDVYIVIKGNFNINEFQFE